MSAPTTDPGTRQRAVRPPLLPTPRPPLPYDGPVTPTDPLMRRVEPLPPLPLDPPRDRNRAVLIALGAVGALLLACIVIATAVLVAPHVTAPAQPAAVTAAPAAPTVAATTPSALPGGATLSCLVSCSSTAPSPTTATDQQYIAGLTTAGLIPTYGGATQMLSLADETCNAMTAGMLWAQAAKVLTDAGFTSADADAFLIATTSTYCPKFVPHD